VTCEEFQEQASSLALGVLEPEERAACEAHLREPRAHAGCEEALRRSLETVAALASAAPEVRPDERVWRGIAARAGIEEAPRARPRGIPVWAAAALAAAVLAGIWLGDRRQSERQRHALEAELRAARGEAEEARALAALLAEPGSRLVELSPLPGRSGRAAAVMNLASRRALVVSSSLEPQPGKVYQLWVIRGAAAPVPAGFLRRAAGALHVGEIAPALLATAPDAFAVSLEPEGGSAAPTDVRLLGRTG
jgi:anti-sigma-K factor RskA